VTGSRIEENDANKSVEQYNIDMDIWFDLPSLNNGRHYHSSCTLGNQFIYVFAGISSETKKYFNSIERFDSMGKGAKRDWAVITIAVDKFPVRQGGGSIAINQNEILIFGGFNSDYLQDSYIFKHSECMLIRQEKDTPIKLFTFQMPTLFDETTGTVITADWQTKKVMNYNAGTRAWTIVSDLNQTK